MNSLINAVTGEPAKQGDVERKAAFAIRQL